MSLNTMPDVSNILIAGGSGAIGRYLEEYLLQRKFNVKLLSRNKSKADGSRIYYWNPEENEIDCMCLENISHIIQLSGANISGKRWSDSRKNEIIKSRVNSTNLLFQCIKNNNIRLQAFISASGVGYYGNVTSSNIYSESDLPGNDFLAQTCVLWEKAADKFSSIGIRTVKIRTSVVLMKHGGAFERFISPSKFGLVTFLGSGNQYFSWIHVDDLCEIYYYAIINEKLNGAFNAAAPSFTTNSEFIMALRHALNKPLLKLHIPEYLLKIALGELSETILNGSRISSDKISNTGFKFNFDTLEKTLHDLLKS